MAPHPLTALSEDEFKIARGVVTKLFDSDVSLYFRALFLQEPKRAELVPFLQAEHAGLVTNETPRPPRRAKLQYDVIKSGKAPEYTQSVVDLKTGQEIERTVAAPHLQTSFPP